MCWSNLTLRCTCAFNFVLETSNNLLRLYNKFCNMSQRIWNIGIIDMVCIVLLCFLYFILYQGAHGDVFIENLALVLMFFCAVVILSTTASLLHAMIYSIPGYREPNFGVSYYSRRRHELHEHIKRSMRATKPPKVIPFESKPRRDLNIKDLILLHDSMMSLNQFMMSHGTQQQLYFNPHLYDCRFNERHQNILEHDNILYPVWQNGSSIFSDSLNPPKREVKCHNCSEKLSSLTHHYCHPSITTISCKRCSNIPCTCKIESNIENIITCKICSNLYQLCKCNKKIQNIKNSINNINNVESDSSGNVTIPIDEIENINIIAMDSLNYNSLGYDIPKSLVITKESIINNELVDYVEPIIRTDTNNIVPINNKDPNPYAGPLIPPPCDTCMENMTICTHNLNYDFNLDMMDKNNECTNEIKIIPMCKTCIVNDEIDNNINSKLFLGTSEINSFVSERVNSINNSVNNVLTPVTTL